MSGRRSREVSNAVRAVQARGLSVTAAASQYGVNISSVRRALRAAGAEPLRPGRPSTKGKS